MKNIDLLDTHLDLLDTDILSKYFACLHNVFKTSSRHVFKTSSRHVFKTSSRHVFKTSSRHVFKRSSRRLQHNNSLSLETSSRRLTRCLQDFFKSFSKGLDKRSLRRFGKTSSRCFGRRKIVTLKTC